MEFGSFPERVGAGTLQTRGAEFIPDSRGGFLDAPVVEVDSFTGDVPDCAPVGCFEMTLGRTRAIAEERVVAIEAFEDGLGDRPCVLGQRSLAGGEGGGGDGHGMMAVSSDDTLVASARPVSTRVRPPALPWES